MKESQSEHKVKILYLVTQGEMGGAQRYVFDLAQNLRDRYQILVLVGGQKTELKTRLEQASISVRVVDNLVRHINFTKDISAIFELKRLFIDFQPDIIHLNSGKAGFLGSIAAHLAGFKNVVFTAHGFSFLEPVSLPLKLIYLFAEKIAKPFRKKIIVVSNTDKQAAIHNHLAKADQVVTIYNGIDTNVISNTSPVPEEGMIIGTIANLYPTKGLTYLIDAAKIVTTKFPSAKFIVIGEGTERPSLEQKIAGANLTKKFFLEGYQKNAATSLSKFNVFILPSVKEGFPYSILEAMAAGLPIVATRVGGIPEVVEDKISGLLVEPQNAKALSEAILKLLGDKKIAAQLGSEAKKQVQDFSLARMIDSTEKIYLEMLAS